MRSIPARAGEPRPWRCAAAARGVYPRACGGTEPASAPHSAQSGLSPRVRGNPAATGRAIACPGSIPARAGEPGCGHPLRGSSGVYPRACGGTAMRARLTCGIGGLSPRVRGNPDHDAHPHATTGSIPARAGEPVPPLTDREIVGVYPRACGGTRVVVIPASAVMGLSPRVRGNPAPDVGPVVNLGSIPARAGEPPRGARSRSGRAVYPRACGGTANPSRGMAPRLGLSPRVRGNPAGFQIPGHLNRSIPARAGEPVPDTARDQCDRVYPRACGGTSVAATSSWTWTGLSPRVRGNRSAEHPLHRCPGSIPARAGEPAIHIGPSSPPGVYPRACGGTQMFEADTIDLTGLSPRVRGNLVLGHVHHVVPGSIPARAGEPGDLGVQHGPRRVYPRACGGTRRSGCTTRPSPGLSPRVRGNRTPAHHCGERNRSIPARAGEPKLTI